MGVTVRQHNMIVRNEMKFLMVHGCYFAKLHILRRKCKRFPLRMNIIIIFALIFIPYYRM
ncbi:hypothetical protein HMPREF9441_02838 [Paraprevotella clara YIT 11840]|uniref:Uncharacterized protein n=1 Tax=Paraprevotella clara YIT 11840 TaxID=762968 RepID=G5STY2_9BACT|nr:hypothetical protein HMPREF9441_02838 [Paraprevotella clara YIT 11840]MBD9177387.1 hypothetical protein [Paraprevotella clara]RGU64744.1 hypothetical protein DWW55_05160 [Paraprevotella clara]